MATKQDIEIIKGRTGTIIDTVTGVSSWTDIMAKLYVSKNYEGTVIWTLEGVIDAENNNITFSYNASDTEDITAGLYYYEIVLYKSDRSFVKTVTYGNITISKPVKVNPIS